LTRIPGVTSVRIDGQSSELNVRGLSGGFVFSTLNGREMVSTSGGRSIQFDIFPSELITGAQVYKSQKASLIEGGVAATINLDTANALYNEDTHSFRASLQGNYNEAAADNEDSDTLGRRLTLAYQGKFLDETLGFSIGWANMFQPTVSSRFVNYKFDEKDLSATYDGAPEEAYVSNGFELNERGGEDERNAFTLALNWEPRDDMRFQFDAFGSKFDSEKWDRGLRVSGIGNLGQSGSTLLIDNPLMSGNTLVGGTIYRDPNGTALAPPYKGASSDLRVQTQADDNTTDSKSLAFGLNGEWNITDDLMVTVDFAHSEGDETYKDQVLRMAYFEDNSVATPIIDDNIIVDYQLNGLNNPYIEFNQDFTSTDNMMVTSAESYPHIESNSSDAMRIDFAYQLDNDYFASVEFGARASQREYELSRARFLYGTTDVKMRNGEYIQYTQDDEGNIVEDKRYQPFQLNSSNSTVTSIGGELSNMPGFLSVDNDAILAAWLPADKVDRTPVRDWDHTWTMTQGNVVEEDVLAAYLQVNIDTQLFDIPLTGNFGVRYVHTDQSSTGLVSAGENGDPIADDLGIINTNYTLRTVGDSYEDVLPSLNLNFQVTDNDQIRFAYAKVMSRAEMPDMANSGNFNWLQDTETNRYQVNLDSSTSPFLRPFYADQFDLSFEHYFTETEGALAVAFWYKDIENMPAESAYEDFDYEAAGIAVPATPDNKLLDENGDPIDYVNGTYTRKENVGDAGYVRGIEIGYTQTFSFLPGYFSGLGANVNFSYTQSDIEVPSQVPGEKGISSPLAGLSPRVLSATVFYEWDDKFEARFSGRYRSAYLEKQTAVGSDEWAYFQDETIYSAQVSYNVTEDLQLTVSADNLTDEPNLSYFSETTKTGTIQYFGRTVYFGVNYTM
jgi:phosphoribosylformimino-5-aminoimidazole carboxamide ribotide isomerase